MGKQLVRKALETTNPERLSIAGDLHADVDEVGSSEIWMRIDSVQFACLASSIVQCFAPVKLAHRVSKH